MNRYFKDGNGKPYQGKKETFEKKLGVVLTEITKEEFDNLVQAINTPSEAQLKDIHNADVLSKIAELEKQQLRPLRELYINPNDTFAKDKLLSIDTQIANLRATLKP